MYICNFTWHLLNTTTWNTTNCHIRIVLSFVCFLLIYPCDEFLLLSFWITNPLLIFFYYTKFCKRGLSNWIRKFTLFLRWWLKQSFYSLNFLLYASADVWSIICNSNTEIPTLSRRSYPIFLAYARHSMWINWPGTDFGLNFTATNGLA